MAEAGGGCELVGDDVEWTPPERDGFLQQLKCTPITLYQSEMAPSSTGRECGVAWESRRAV